MAGIERSDDNCATELDLIQRCAIVIVRKNRNNPYQIQYAPENAMRIVSDWVRFHEEKWNEQQEEERQERENMLRLLREIISANTDPSLVYFRGSIARALQAYNRSGSSPPHDMKVLLPYYNEQELELTGENIQGWMDASCAGNQERCVKGLMALHAANPLAFT